MSIDLSKVTAISDQYGPYAQITDASGRVLWAVSGGKVILEVEKITSDTYAGETTYTGEQFILLDIYPKTNGTVTVTYGGLTKTITDTSGAEEPNAQQVFFGTFNGVSDSVTTPASGELTIEGDYYAWAQASFKNNKYNTTLCHSITEIVNFGSPKIIPSEAFGGLSGTGNPKIKSVTIPKSVASIGYGAFAQCFALESVTIASGVASIEEYAFFKLSIEAPEKLAQMTITMQSTTPCELVGSQNDDGTVSYHQFAAVAGKETCIIVPKGCGEAYKTAEGWSTYADYIVEAS